MKAEGLSHITYSESHPGDVNVVDDTFCNAYPTPCCCSEKSLWRIVQLLAHSYMKMFLAGGIAGLPFAFSTTISMKAFHVLEEEDFRFAHMDQSFLQKGIFMELLF